MKNFIQTAFSKDNYFRTCILINAATIPALVIPWAVIWKRLRKI